MLAVIGGSGWDQLPEFECLETLDVTTPYGVPAAQVRRAQIGGGAFYFLPRHGVGHTLAPHKINYRANLWALKSLGVSQVLAINAVGGIGSDAAPGQLICPDQLIDYTWGRDHTFHEDPVQHIEFAQPFDVGLRCQLLAIAQRHSIAMGRRGVYGCTQGPRLETAAEIQRLRRDGCTLVGMTAMPEAALARELGLAYASICISVNWAAGLSDEAITMDAIRAVLEDSRPAVVALVQALAGTDSEVQI